MTKPRLQIVKDNQEDVKMDWMSAIEACRFLGVTYGALRNMVYRRQVPFYKLEHRVRFKYSELTVHLERTRQGVGEWRDAN